MFKNIKVYGYIGIILVLSITVWIMLDDWHYKPLRNANKKYLSCENNCTKKIHIRDYALTQAGKMLSVATDNLQECKDNINVDYLQMYFKTLDANDTKETEDETSIEDNHFNLYTYSF